MPDSPSAWLRSLADKSTRTVDPSMPDQDWLEKAYARRDLFALSPDLAVLCADAIDALEKILAPKTGPTGFLSRQYGGDGFPEEIARDMLARFAALQPDNTEEGTK